MMNNPNPSTQPKRLYVWTDFAPDWSGGLAVAIASSEEEARALVIAAHGTVREWGTLSVHELNTPFAAAISGGG